MEERILKYVDIDTRRALGLPPRRLQIDRAQILMNQYSKKYYPDRKIYIEVYQYDWWHTDIKIWTNMNYDPATRRFFHTPDNVSVMRQTKSYRWEDSERSNYPSTIWVKDADT